MQKTGESVPMFVLPQPTTCFSTVLYCQATNRTLKNATFLLSNRDSYWSNNHTGRKLVTLKFGLVCARCTFDLNPFKVFLPYIRSGVIVKQNQSYDEDLSWYIYMQITKYVIMIIWNALRHRSMPAAIVQKLYTKQI